MTAINKILTDAGIDLDKREPLWTLLVVMWTTSVTKEVGMTQKF